MNKDITAAPSHFILYDLCTQFRKAKSMTANRADCGKEAYQECKEQAISLMSAEEKKAHKGAYTLYGCELVESKVLPARKINITLQSDE